MIPDEVPLEELVGQTDLTKRIPLGRTTANRLVDVALFSNPVFMVVGPEESGRSQALASLVRGLDASGRVTSRSLVAGRRSPLLSSLGGWDKAVTGVDAAMELLPELNEAPICEDETAPFSLVVIDDADDLVDGGVSMSMSKLVRRARDTQRIVLVSLSMFQAARGYCEWVNYCKQNRHGLMLMPSKPADGDTFNVDLPKRANLVLPQGRGYLVSRAPLVLVQVGR